MPLAEIPFNEPAAFPVLAERPPRESAERDALAIVGESDGMKYVMSRVEQVAHTDATVLLLGETGTGKELVARSIHRQSRRADRPLVVVNCAALPATIIESELFGRERGAFTGAHATQIGRFELAHRGTILLDEIGELPLELQPKLLRVLQNGEIERLGSPRTVEVDLRLIAATNRDLVEDVRQGRFRADLFYRLNVFPITLPSLRDRRDDIATLVRHLVARFSRLLHKRIDVIPPVTMRALEAYEWPGNVRELENVLQRAIIMSAGGALTLTEPWRLRSLQAARADGGDGATLAEVERRHIVRVLESCRWRIEGTSGSAQILGLKPSTLRSRMIKLRIERPT
ncbi:MAG TPA: sigma 54-interacting transcriptional regulator [Vicinamibacterales bacterium]|nr:sigma 54-interacting transcriptional regulator [Vicinamibacterales bacterium]